jgi:hypothetical protein
MATKAVGQVDVVDVTDAYSVILTSEAHTFPGTTSAAKAGSTTTQVIAMQGDTQVAASVMLSEVTAPTGVTVTKDTDATAPTLTIAVSTAVTSAGTVTIPVHIKDVTIDKVFSFAIALTGSQGASGTNGTNGADALTLVVTSSNGTIFKNSSIATVLTAHVYKGGVEVTGDALAVLGAIKWYKDGSTTAAATGATLTIDAGDVTGKATYVAQLEG